MCLQTINAKATDGRPAFRKFMVADGLSDNTVLCALRDSNGFAWLGTNNGLNCFDGSRNTVYRNMVKGTAAYENNTITALFEMDNNIWFGGAFGLYVYHRFTNAFSRFEGKTQYGVTISSTVTKIVRRKNGLIWIGTLGQGLFTYNPQNREMKQDSRHVAFVSDIVVTQDGKIYVVSLQGNLLIYNANGAFQQSYQIPDYVFDKNSICLEHTSGETFLGTDRGLYHLSDGDKSIQPFTIPLPDINIRSLKAWGKELLVGTEKGLYLMDLKTRKTMRFDNPNDPLRGLSDITVNGLMWDQDSTLWVMTQAGGVCYMPTMPNGPQQVIMTAGKDGQNLTVRTFCKTSDGRLWVGTDAGLFVGKESKTQGHKTIWEHYPLNADKGRSPEITVLMPDGAHLWIGTHQQGIFVIDTKGGAIRHYEYSSDRPYTVTSNKINSIVRTPDGNIYVGTDWSLCRFDRQTENFMWFAEIGSMTNITSVTVDGKGCVWAATSNHGLFRQVSPGGGFRNYTYNQNVPEGLTSNYITTVFCDHNNDVWIATNGSGLCRYIAASDRIERFGQPGTLLQERRVYFITEDKQHNLWMGLGDGMARIDSKRSPEQIKQIKAPLLQENEQAPLNSAFMSPDGELYAGRYGMFVHFYPEQVKFQNSCQPVFITAISLPFRTDADAEEKRLNINRPFLKNTPIELPFSDNSFTLHFAAPRFTGNSDTRFEFMLQGIDKTWARGTRNAEATYANVPPGTYEFLLREAGSIDEGSYAHLTITILPPWYRTTLAYMLYLLLLAAAVYMAVRSYNRLLKQRYQRRIEEFRIQQEKKNFESKIQFFINLVHEIRTPLSLISLPLEQIENKSVTAEEKRHTSAIRRNMNYLLGITNQLLSFQKAEEGKIQLNLQNCDVGQLLREIYDQFEDAMRVQGKNLQLQIPELPIMTDLDREKISKVLMNMTGNAFKYAKSEIILRLQPEGEHRLRISVIDDGPGVPPAERPHIFDAYYQIAGDNKAHNLGTGLGLAYAKMLAKAHGGDMDVEEASGGGSDFYLTIPIRNREIQKSLPKQERPEDLEQAEKRGNTLKATTFRILLVEDNEELLQMTSEALLPSFRITKARDGIEALDILRHEDIDVIVSDVMMPRLDGIGLCQKVKNDINYSHIPLILLTAKTSVEAKLEGMQVGADIYLEKPFSAHQLKLQIINLLRMRQTFHERMRSLEGTVRSAEEGEFGLNRQDLLFMERLQKMIDENMRDEDFSIDTLAGQMNMSRSSFYRKIKALTGITPIEYLKTRRLERAATLLNQGCRSSEVAEQVGFTSSSYFAKCFKAKYGVLPKDYIQQKTS